MRHLTYVGMKYAFTVLLLSIVAFSQSPDALKSQTKSHRFFDRPAKIALAISAGVFAADAATTCHNLANGGHEQWLPAQSCAGVTTWMAGSFATELGVSYLLHRKEHHRLERSVETLWATPSALGIMHSLTQDSPKPAPAPPLIPIPVRSEPGFCIVGQTC